MMRKGMSLLDRMHDPELIIPKGADLEKMVIGEWVSAGKADKELKIFDCWTAGEYFVFGPVDGFYHRVGRWFIEPEDEDK